MTNRDQSNQSDPRVLRTRQLIRDAFIDLLEETELEKLTVNRIAERATINRVTFYLHYKDIPDMLDRIADDIINQMYDALRSAPKEPTAVLVRLLEHVQENTKLFKLLLVTKRVPVFTERFMSVTGGLIAGKIENYFKRTDNHDIQAEIGSWYLSSAIIGTIITWLRHDTPYSPEYLAKQIRLLSPQL
ncbi:TetR-like C-terminal domain-containing protein [Paenibacillus sp. HB172176]|uniref:TetR-like C-terminal domain-containing protein n=1 Tax=Paenibacillus sp. HB172176 TaxID=2493690 RepID=UPI00143C1105|nr:TetR-like C-terminal domain-containing protein [Paenibacillus sp. HB172176]